MSDNEQPVDHDKYKLLPNPAWDWGAKRTEAMEEYYTTLVHNITIVLRDNPALRRELRALLAEDESE